MSHIENRLSLGLCPSRRESICLDRRNRAALLCLVMLLFARPLTCETVSAGADREIRWSAGVLFPWVYEEKGQYKGVLYDLVSRFAEARGVGLEVRQGAAQRTIIDVATGETDLAIIPHTHVKKGLFPGSGPGPNCEVVLLDLRLVSVGSRNTFPDGRINGDYEEYRFLVRRQALNLDENVTRNGRVEIAVNSSDSMVKTLLSGRVDVLISTSADIFMAARALGEEERLVILNTHSPMELRMCFSQKFIAAQSRAFLSDAQKIINRFAQDEKLVSNLEKMFGPNAYYTLGSTGKQSD